VARVALAQLQFADPAVQASSKKGRRYDDLVIAACVLVEDMEFWTFIGGLPWSWNRLQ
jgi:hypothetical protein